MSREPKMWRILERTVAYEKAPWLRIEHHTVELPDGRRIEEYHRISQPDFSVVFATTPEGLVIAERQYRHGFEGISLDFPAGLVDEGETPEEACRRELLEETGYQARNWVRLGSFWLHGNYGLCRSHLFMADTAVRVAEPHGDGLEEIETLLMTPAEIRDALREERIPLVTSAAIASMGLARIGVAE